MNLQNISLQNIFDAVLELRSMLDVWGVTSQTLLIAGGIALILLMLSLREVLAWYLKISDLKSQMTVMSQEIVRLQDMLADTRSLLLQSREEELEEAVAKSEVPNVSSASEEAKPANRSHRFRFDH
jgi:hypothetical protein